jgi:two-component system response regulator MprA
MAKTLLVVNDEPAMRSLLEFALEGEGYEVAGAADGLEAIERLNTLRPSLILLDLLMPRMDGVAFAKELRRRGLRPGVPIMILSAACRADQVAAEIGAEACLGGPFDLSELLERVKQLTACA